MEPVNVQVTWLDSKRVFDGWEFLAEITECPSPSLIETTGWMIAQSAEAIMVSSSIGGGQVCGAIVIPRCAIQTMVLFTREAVRPRAPAGE